MVWWEASQQVQTCPARFTAVLQAIAPPQRIEDAGVCSVSKVEMATPMDLIYQV